MSGWTARFAALICFLTALVVSSAWEMHVLVHEGEARLRQEAESLAKRASLYFAGISWEMNAPAARSSIFAEMEDPRLAAMLIYGKEGVLEGMRRNRLWEPVPWDDLIPENSMEASVPIMMEDVPVGEVLIYLSRRTLDEELSARARRELARVAALAVLPCFAIALLLRRLAAQKTAEVESDALKLKTTAAPESPIQPPTKRNDTGTREVCPETCRAFIRDQRDSAALLYTLAAREEWGELRAKAHALHEAACAINARVLAAAALSVRDAALDNTASAARRVEECVHALAGVLGALEQPARGNAETPNEQNP